MPESTIHPDKRRPQARELSPPSGDPTWITSAPRSPRHHRAVRTARARVRSKTRIPVKAPDMKTPFTGVLRIFFRGVQKARIKAYPGFSGSLPYPAPYPDRPFEFCRGSGRISSAYRLPSISPPGGAPVPRPFPFPEYEGR